jgi:hypothetical protein
MDSVTTAKSRIVDAGRQAWFARRRGGVYCSPEVTA